MTPASRILVIPTLLACLAHFVVAGTPACAEETESQHYAKSEDVYRYAIGRDNLSLGVGYALFSLEHSEASPTSVRKPVVSLRYRHNFSDWFKIEYTGSYSGPHSDYWTLDLSAEAVPNGTDTIANSLAMARLGRAFNFRNFQVTLYGGILLFLPSASHEPHLARFHMGLAGLALQHTFSNGSLLLFDTDFMSIGGVQTLHERLTYGRRLQLYVEHLQFNIEQADEITNVVHRALSAGLVLHLF